MCFKLSTCQKDDLKVVVSYLRSNKQISCIGLWGRSMGAVTSLLYGAEDPSIAGMVLDSAFSNLFDLMMELVDVYKIRLPKFTVKMAVQYMRRVIQKKAKFDIMDLNCTKVGPKTYIPALFGHAAEDVFIQPHHSEIIFKSYAGDKNIIKFDGDHNSPRPQFYYDSVSIFFYNVLHPPQVSSAYSSKLEKYYDLGDLKVGAGMDESLLYEIIAGLRNVGTEAASSSSAPPSISTTKSIGEFLSEIAPVANVLIQDSLLVEDNMTNDFDRVNDDESRHLQVIVHLMHLFFVFNCFFLVPCLLKLMSHFPNTNAFVCTLSCLDYNMIFIPGLAKSRSHFRIEICASSFLSSSENLIHINLKLMPSFFFCDALQLNKPS
uniref:Serine aminopeptidase S33 domain-containing protein n=1 Tax=Nelumbo nucifera TaxID=4432 RepID=A0A822XTQ8_NELNU|nr:TPA_asm: hypothetical protein HUJ06_025233 [Nelumbo nucifera]